MMITPPLRYRSVNGYTVSNKGMGSAAASGVLQVVPYAGVFKRNPFSAISINKFEQFLASYKQTSFVCHTDIHHKACNKVHRQGSSGSEKNFLMGSRNTKCVPIEARFVQVHAMMRSQ